MSIAITRSVGGFFHEVVGEAVRTQQVDATDEAMSYLVALLTEFAHPDPVDGRHVRPAARLPARRGLPHDRSRAVPKASHPRRRGALHHRLLRRPHREPRRGHGLRDQRRRDRLPRSGLDARARPDRATRRTGPSEPTKATMSSASSPTKFDRFVDVLTTVAETHARSAGARRARRPQALRAMASLGIDHAGR